MTPTMIQVFRLDDAPDGRERWSWEVEFADRGLNQEGFQSSFDATMACVNYTVQCAAREATP